LLAKKSGDDFPRLGIVGADRQKIAKHIFRLKCRSCRWALGAEGGGARRDRTADLLHAMQALSQLSYGPVRNQISALSNQKVKAPRPAQNF
jgi:hypothetical protein